MAGASIENKGTISTTNLGFIAEEVVEALHDDVAKLIMVDAD